MIVILLLSSVLAQNDSSPPATGKAVYITDVEEGEEIEGNVGGVVIKETGTGGEARTTKDYTIIYSSTTGPGRGTSSTPPGQEGEGILSTILRFGSLSFLFGGEPENQLCGFLRILLLVLAFTLFYLLFSLIPGLTRGTGITLSIVFALLITLFTPCTILLAWGTTYATLFALVIVFGPVLAAFAGLVFTPTPNRIAAVLKLVVVLILMWLVYEISFWAKQMGGI
ncbi:hypothetical protein HY496_02845 [Candidatus Woesearchaeota archaeon]|nr:hypothetical protein [Candidatus Woesearchaeota archaeon]